MTLALVITCEWPANPDRETHRIFQWLSLFLDALYQSFDSVETMLFAPRSASLNANAHRLEWVLHEMHGRGIYVNEQLRRPNPSFWGLHRRPLANSRSIDQPENYINIGGSWHITAVKRALEPNPALVLVSAFDGFRRLCNQALPGKIKWPFRDLGLG